MQGMLQRLPERRLTIEEILRHPYMRPHAQHALKAAEASAPAAAAAGPVMTEDTLAALMHQLAKHTQAGGVGDVDILSKVRARKHASTPHASLLSFPPLLLLEDSDNCICDCTGNTPRSSETIKMTFTSLRFGSSIHPSAVAPRLYLFDPFRNFSSR